MRIKDIHHSTLATKQRRNTLLYTTYHTTNISITQHYLPQHKVICYSLLATSSERYTLLFTSYHITKISLLNTSYQLQIYALLHTRYHTTKKNNILHLPSYHKDKRYPTLATITQSQRLQYNSYNTTKIGITSQ